MGKVLPASTKATFDIVNPFSKKIIGCSALDTLPLHIADSLLTTQLAGLQSLIVDYKNNCLLTPMGIDPNEYNNIVVAFTNILCVTLENYILPALENVCLNNLICFEYIRPHICTIKAILAVLHSWIGIYGYSAIGRPIEQ